MRNMYSMVHRVKFSEGQNITKINNRYHSKEKNIKIISENDFEILSSNSNKYVVKLLSKNIN